MPKDKFATWTRVGTLPGGFEVLVRQMQPKTSRARFVRTCVIIRPVTKALPGTYVSPALISTHGARLGINVPRK